jgi:hypothetical protein
MNKDKKTAAAAQPPPPATQVMGQQPMPAVTTPAAAAPINVPKLATPMAMENEVAAPKKMDELIPTLRPPAGSFSGGSIDGGDSDTEEHLQV